MQKINYIIVDDEPQARRLLETYMSGLEPYQLCAVCANAMEAYQALQTQAVDLMFLDIKMPQVSGMELLRSLKNPPLAILTTAFAKYALEGYALNVADYLLKPIALPRLLQALEKVSARLAPRAPEVNDHLFLRIDGKLVRVDLPDILLIEGMQNYVKLHLPGKILIAPHTMKETEELISRPDFIRVHRSYLVPLKMIRAVNGNTIETGYREVPIGGSYRAALLAQLNH